MPRLNGVIAHAMQFLFTPDESFCSCNCNPGFTEENHDVSIYMATQDRVVPVIGRYTLIAIDGIQ